MFKENLDKRLSSWFDFRQKLNKDDNPFNSVSEFWKSAPFIPFNHKIDRYNKNLWPTPWEIIVENKYDDFTKALMIGWTLKFTDRFKNNHIELRSVVDNCNNSNYNIICVDNHWIINYSETGAIPTDMLPQTIFIEYYTELATPK